MPIEDRPKPIPNQPGVGFILPTGSTLLITPDVLAIIDSALAEDVSMGDPTTDILIDSDLSGRAEMTAREPGVLAGIEVAAAVFRRLDPSLASRDRH